MKLNISQSSLNTVGVLYYVGMYCPMHCCVCVPYSASIMSAIDRVWMMLLLRNKVTLRKEYKVLLINGKYNIIHVHVVYVISIHVLDYFGNNLLYVQFCYIIIIIMYFQCLD